MTTVYLSRAAPSTYPGAVCPSRPLHNLPRRPGHLMVLDPIGEVRQVRRVVGGEDPVEIFADGDEVIIVAQVRVERLDRNRGRRVGEDQVTPVDAVGTTAEVRLPAVAVDRPGELLIQQ